MIDFSLSDEQKKLRQQAREFAQMHIAPVALDFDKEPAFPGEIIQKAHAAGLMNLTCPKEYAGQGLGLVDASLVTEELNAACVAISGMIGMNMSCYQHNRFFGNRGYNFIQIFNSGPCIN